MVDIKVSEVRLVAGCEVDEVTRLGSLGGVGLRFVVGLS
jgi:hypothetical protein